MPVDISCVIIASQNTQNGSFESERGRWRRGEFNDVLPEMRGRPGANLNDLNYDGLPKFYYVHVRGCPGTLDEVKALLLDNPIGARRTYRLMIGPGSHLSLEPDRRATLLSTGRLLFDNWEGFAGSTALEIFSGIGSTGNVETRPPGDRPVGDDGPGTGN